MQTRSIRRSTRRSAAPTPSARPTSIRSRLRLLHPRHQWATLRIQDRGVIAYVTNGGWLDSNTADGMRKSLAEEFSSIYVLNLRGNQRTAGEQSRKEGGKVFGGGSRATVAMTLLVRDPGEVWTGHDPLHRYRRLPDGRAEASQDRCREHVWDSNPSLILRQTNMATGLISEGRTSLIHADRRKRRSANISSWTPWGSLTNRDAWAMNFSQPPWQNVTDAVCATRESAGIGAEGGVRWEGLAS